jgi:four helix bundle protein
MDNKINSFKDLIVWKKGHLFVLNIYKITKNFPIVERYCLIDQMRRAAVSITSNIAEGFCRRTYLDKNSFYIISLSSLEEVYNQVIISKDLNYINNNIYMQLENQIIEIRKMLFSLIKSSRTK